MASRAIEHPPVREAREEDAQDVADILAEAFAHDPVMNWMYGDSRPIRTTFVELAKGIFLRKGFGHIAGNSAATLWAPAGVAAKLPLLNELRILFAAFRAGGVSAIGRASATERVMAANHPKEEHFYLFAVGVRLNLQGKGFGGRIIREGLKMADKVGAPVYLENSNPRNALLYERLGFRALAPLDLPDGAPPLLAMLRDARCAL